MAAASPAAPDAPDGAARASQPPSCPHFAELPEHAKHLILSFLSSRDVVSAALCTRELRAVAAPFTWRMYCCKACGSHLFPPRDVLKGGGDTPTIDLGDGPAMCLRQRPEGSRGASPHSAWATCGALPEMQMDVEDLLCRGCGVYLGFLVHTVEPTKTLPRVFSGSLPQLAGRALLCARYLRLHCRDGTPSTPPEAPPLQCSGARGTPPSGGKLCGNVLAERDQVLSKQHCWDAGGGAENAWYLNALRPGSFTVGVATPKRLAQGVMFVADVHCSQCQARIGWKFCQVGPAKQPSYRNLNQVGRFGVVTSSILREWAKQQRAHERRGHLASWQAVERFQRRLQQRLAQEGADGGGGGHAPVGGEAWLRLVQVVAEAEEEDTSEESEDVEEESIFWRDRRHWVVLEERAALLGSNDD